MFGFNRPPTHIILEGANLVGKTTTSRALGKEGRLELRSFHNVPSPRWTGDKGSLQAEESLLRSAGVPFQTFLTPLYVADTLAKLAPALSSGTIQDRSMFTSLVYGQARGEELWIHESRWRDIFEYWLQLCFSVNAVFVHLSFEDPLDYHRRRTARCSALDFGFEYSKTIDESFGRIMKAELGSRYNKILVDGCTSKEVARKVEALAKCRA